jgi:hypothetical protein
MSMVDFHQDTYCDDASMQSRVDHAYYDAAEALVEADQHRADPVLRYVIIKDRFQSVLEALDDGLDSFCADQGAQPVLALSRAREPLASALKVVHDNAKRVAIAGADEAALNLKANAARIELARLDVEERRVTCDAVRKIPEGTEYDDPLLRQGRAGAIAICEQEGL